MAASRSDSRSEVKSVDQFRRDSADFSDLDQLPNPIVIVRGFLEPYGVLRGKNGTVAQYKRDICTALSTEIKKADSLEAWEVILQQLDNYIEKERGDISAGWSNTRIAVAGKQLGAAFGSWIGIKDTTESDDQQINLKNVFLILLLGARTYACAQLQQKNRSWQEKIVAEFEEAKELQQRIVNAKINTKVSTTKDVPLLDPKWEQELKLKLENLAKKYYLDAIINGQYWLKLFLPDPKNALLDHIPKSNHFVPEHLQPDFHERAYLLVQQAFDGRFEFKGRTFKDFEQYLIETYKDESLPSRRRDSAEGEAQIIIPGADSSLILQAINAPIAGAGAAGAAAAPPAAAVVAAPTVSLITAGPGPAMAIPAPATPAGESKSPHPEKIIRKLEAEEVQLLEKKLPEPVNRTYGKAWNRIKTKLSKDQSTLGCNSWHDPQLLDKLELTDWQFIGKILQDTRAILKPDTGPLTVGLRGF